MKSKVISIIILFMLSIFLFSCNQENRKEDEIVSSTIQNKEGQILKLKFNNTIGTLDLELNDEKILLNKVPSGSGVKCVNDEYEYYNWHGETTLMKNNEIIFYHKEE